MHHEECNGGACVGTGMFGSIQHLCNEIVKLNGLACVELLTVFIDLEKIVGCCT